MSTTPAAPAAPNTGKMPRQIPFIIGNEGCERFSYYGMRNILTEFMAITFFAYMNNKALQKVEAKEVFHTFVMGVYFFPLLGGWLSDRFFGKYNTIFWLSLVYCVGQGCLAMNTDNQTGFYIGLFLIALGSGGIKPLVSAFVGDQFDKSNKHLSKKVYDAFYWIINFGSFFASLMMPVLWKNFGPRVAFAVPGVLMAVSTVIFWAGRGKYIEVPPTAADPHSFLRVARSALLARSIGKGFRPGLFLAMLGVMLALASPALLAVTSLKITPVICLALVAVLLCGGIGTWIQLERARDDHSEEVVEGARSVLRILVMFAFITPFWSLFDQKASTWVLMAGSDMMIRPDWFTPSQMQTFNPALVLMIIPFNNFILYPWLKKKWSFEPTALQKMGFGLFVAASSWVVMGGIQVVMDEGTKMHMAWQIIPYVLLTFGEVFVSATGLEFAYSQAPPTMKGAIMSFWLLSVTIGNLWVLLVNATLSTPSVASLVRGTGLGADAFLMFFFAALAFLAAIAFRLYSRRYKMVDYYRASSPAEAPPDAVPAARVVKDGDK